MSMIRKPYDDELRDCARLLYISGPHLYCYIFSLNEPEIFDFLNYLLKMPGLYSKDNVFIEEDAGMVKGLCAAYPVSDMNRITRHMMAGIIGFLIHLGFANFIKVIQRLKLNSYFPKLGNDEFFISNLAVFEKYRGQGTAQRLMEKAEEMARLAGLKKISLYVETDNDRAIHYYVKAGFQEIETILLPETYHRFGLQGFKKMVKPVVDF